MTNNSRLDLVAARNRRRMNSDALALAAFTAVLLALIVALWRPAAPAALTERAASLAASTLEGDAVPTATAPAAPCPRAAAAPRS